MSTAIGSLLRLRGRRVRLCFAFQVFEYLSAVRLNVVRVCREPDPTEVKVIDFYVDGAVGVVFWVSVFDHYEILKNTVTASGAAACPSGVALPIALHVPEGEPPVVPSADE